FKENVLRDPDMSRDEAEEYLFAEKLKTIKALIFDWDGVFNNGVKTDNIPSSFSEADSMGINMLRFGYWLETSKIPQVFIITGRNNEAAKEFAIREHFTAVYTSVKNKVECLPSLKKEWGVTPDQVAFVFDDVLDVSLAQKSALRFLVKRAASPLFEQFVSYNQYCDYITYSEGGKYPVREICELILGAKDIYTPTISERVQFSEKFKVYMSLRNETVPEFF
ncbi:MAG: phosphatase, partial [Cytophagales bacterium]|nr:phosphatase [Cytophagales bacterium]